MGGLSESLRQAMAHALDEGGQVILLLNRRGFHTFVLCPRCGHVVKCHACDVAATYHKSRHILICHTCDAERACPPACPGCGAHALHYGGIGTERLEREIHTAFPDVVARRMDSDTMRSPGSHEQVLSAFKEGDVRILLGTQMIAKGLDFPNVTLVGVVNADTALHLPDFRAAERTFQLVAQVAGRTGRGDRPGRVLVQTYSPDHPAIRSAATHDYEGFARSELPEREKYGVPPYGRIVRLIARGPEEPAVSAYMNDLAAAFRAAADSVRPRPGTGTRPRSSRSATSIGFTSSCAAPTRGRFSCWRTRCPGSTLPLMASSWRSTSTRSPCCERLRACIGRRSKNREFCQKTLKFRLQHSRIGLSSQPFVHTRDSRRRNSWLNSGHVGQGG